MIIVIAHWAEHLVQAYQVYVLKWPLHRRGCLGPGVSLARAL